MQTCSESKSQEMGKKRTAIASQSWNLLRLALHWARKGGIFNRRLITDLMRSFIKSLRCTARNSLTYGERELSFDETPLFNFKVPRHAPVRFQCLPHIPCINPSIDFDDDGGFYIQYRDSSFNRSDMGEDCECSKKEDDLNGCEELCEGEEGVDSKAEQFINRFYEQMRLQRQISYLQYNEMLQRGAS